MVNLTVDQAITKAKTHAKDGDIATARALLNAVLKAAPNNKIAKKLMSDLPPEASVAQTSEPPQGTRKQLLELYNQGKFVEAVNLADEVLKEFPKSFLVWNIYGAANKILGHLTLAHDSFEKVTQLNPNYPDGFNNLGYALKDQGNLKDAISSYQKAISLKPDYAEAHSNLGAALRDQGNLKDAISSYQKAISFKPDYAEAHNNLGTAFQLHGNLKDAIASYQEAISLKPDYALAHNNLGAALKDQGNLKDAISYYQKAISLKPDYAEAHYNLGNVLKDQGNLKDAIASYQKAISLKPDDAQAHNNLGAALNDQGNIKDAIASYQKAISLKPDYAYAHYNLGKVLKDQGNLKDAIASYQKTISFKPDFANAHNNLGNALIDQGYLTEAISSYQKAISLKPDYAQAHAQMIHQKAHVCDWSKTSDDVKKESLLGIETDAIAPFTMLGLEDEPSKHQIRSELFSKSKYPQKRKGIRTTPKSQSERLKIGYFSADFHDHATMHLMSQVFALHDKDRFEVHVFSYGANTNDAMRKKLIENVDAFHDVRDLSDPQIVEKARALKLDLAIDLKGYTRDTRLAAFAEGIAPVQMSFLGFPGTLGASFIDYIVADPIVIPKELQKHYSEQIMYLPNTYQPTDNTRHISDPRPSRQSVGLPETGFVFACFNNNYKISPREFDIWMRLLTKVEGSVLWLLRSNKWAEQNLKKEAEARGVSAERLIFAERIPQADHLARQALADLFLDTFNYNAHTTTSDALWAGLPVLTKMGQGFAARVAGSLLAANGLPELITETEEEYEALALDLATNPKKLAALKSKLTANLKTHPLFDSELFTRHLEQGYEMAIQNHLEGNAPKTFYIPSENKDITDAKPRSKIEPQTRPPARVTR